jgi:hypothetical protein
MPNHARQINNTSSFFDYPFVKDVQGGVLRVDGVGDEGVDEEGPVGVYFEDGLKVLQVYATEGEMQASDISTHQSCLGKLLRIGPSDRPSTCPTSCSSKVRSGS